jgi:hypothetical protein
MKKDSRIAPLQDILSNLFLDMKVDNKMANVKILGIWDQAVGERIAENTAPESIRRGILFVNVANSVWMQQLHFLKDEILAKINNALDSPRIKEIRFKIGKTPGSAPPTTEMLPPLDKEEMAEIERQSSSIEDKDLRRSFQHLMATHLKNRKSKGR